MKRLALVGLVVLAGCAGNIDPPWQLSHERIIAVRATPPHVVAGAQSTIDVLVGHVGSDGSNVQVEPPDSASVTSPVSLMSILSGDTLTAPSDAELDQVRSELGLGSADPVPVELQIEADGFEALKTVFVGDSGDNPTLDGLMINGAVPPSDPAQTIVVPADVDVPLFVNAAETVDNINWLTSCGTMNDYNLHDAFVHVKPTDPQIGQLALVVRDESGGVAWQYWSIAAQ
ncbi:MAG TPA: hypothetical protein VGL61_29615 [Kofleriaceae bacterium]